MERPHNDELSAVSPAVPHGAVMIVDSDAAYARVLRAYLELRGFCPRVCSAREAMRDLRGQQPLALVLDFDAPGVDAFDLLHVMSDELGTAQVIVCSRHPEPAEPERSCLRELGVTHWLRRPCNMDELARALGEIEAARVAYPPGGLRPAALEA
jgi:DNA-binding response OmpR family regulator